ncbi:hypothetical protein E3E11_02910 [Oecophyllibacter saccharovorans]|uniref:hypothetical protein n=1 Tax=Oecophyllibacter saccharovorans TaxID=2558360 RepID=UPI001141E6FA|nr:hypothetical protein [Oecophyllibacter saccharovorans]QDH14987.1 hypothetical protein E3E11_02910 [Oecophyllibacter saccharovorans]
MRARPALTGTAFLAGLGLTSPAALAQPSQTLTPRAHIPAKVASVPPAAALGLGMQVKAGEAATLAAVWKDGPGETLPIFALFAVTNHPDPACPPPDLETSPAPSHSKRSKGARPSALPQCPVVTLALGTERQFLRPGAFPLPDLSLLPLSDPFLEEEAVSAGPEGGEKAAPVIPAPFTASLGPYGLGAETDLQAGFYALLQGPGQAPTRTPPSEPPPVLMVSTYTGGAHCCDRIRLYYDAGYDTPGTVSAQAAGMPGPWRVYELPQQDGSGLPSVLDVPGDPAVPPVVVLQDQSFDYTFAPHAESIMPPVLTALHLGPPGPDGLRSLIATDMTASPAYRPYLLASFSRIVAEMTSVPNTPAGKSAAARKLRQNPGFLAYAMAIACRLAASGGPADQKTQDRIWRAVLQAPVEKNSMFGVSPCTLMPQEAQAHCTPAQQRTLPFPQGLRAFLMTQHYLTPAQAENFPTSLAAFETLRQRQAREQANTLPRPVQAVENSPKRRESSVQPVLRPPVAAESLISRFRHWLAQAF